MHSGEKQNNFNHYDFASSQAANLRTHFEIHSGKKQNKFNHFAYSSSYVREGEYIWKHTEQVQDFARGKPTEIYPWCYFCVLTYESSADVVDIGL